MPRRLALVTAPRADETFASWVDRMARVNRCPPAEVANLMGLHLRGVYASTRPPVFGVQCDEAVRQAVYAATGVPGSAVDRMHLSVFEDGPLSVAAVLSASKARGPSAAREWVEVYGSRACPCCLLASGGVWRLWWKLSCAAVCPEHQVKLLDRCPACGWALRWGGARPRVRATVGQASNVLREFRSRETVSTVAARSSREPGGRADGRRTAAMAGHRVPPGISHAGRREGIGRRVVRGVPRVCDLLAARAAHDHGTFAGRAWLVCPGSSG
ncbi:TniQ family protein [Streptomyces sp. Root264]|uniref:TniQ family protein n=1 Tax=unclassified Streptomyces TaxID=2593676 RepID=UPI000B24DC6F